MDRAEFDWHWKDKKPIEGFGFLLNDSVRVMSGSHCGSRGSVVSVVEMEPEPLYLVKLEDRSEVPILESALLTATAQDPGKALAILQRWYSSMCDDDWEHEFGMEIGTLDNPGWSVKINLEGTPLKSAPFVPVEKNTDPVEDEREREWISCKIEDGHFKGYGGPHMLGAILEVFMRWVEEVGR